MTNPSKTAKTALKKAFPNVTFTLKTIRENLFIKWNIELGSPATVNAVSAVIIPNETAGYEDSHKAFYLLHCHGIYLEPKFSPEVKAAAIAYVKETSDATWDEKYEYFREASGARNEYAIKRFEYYCGNQLTSPLLDEYGHEPIMKRFYYTQLAESAIKTENGCIQLVQL